MADYDRLTTLIDRFALQVEPAPPERASLALIGGPDGRPDHVLYRPTNPGFEVSRTPFLFSALVDWGGATNPLLAGLPDEIVFDVNDASDTALLVHLLGSELAEGRCGGSSVVNRLAEVLMVRILRHLIEEGSAQPGVLAGLADPRISRAIVAIHDHPGRAWRNDDLASLAGLSLSRFSEVFLSTVGESPAVYLRHWRLTLARQDVRRGDRIEAVARRYGYGSAEGFTRAFKKQFGTNPLAQRRLVFS